MAKRVGGWGGRAKGDSGISNPCMSFRTSSVRETESRGWTMQVEWMALRIQTIKITAHIISDCKYPRKMWPQSTLPHTVHHQPTKCLNEWIICVQIMWLVKERRRKGGWSWKENWLNSSKTSKKENFTLICEVFASLSVHYVFLIEKNRLIVIKKFY